MEAAENTKPSTELCDSAGLSDDAEFSHASVWQGLVVVEAQLDRAVSTPIRREYSKPEVIRPAILGPFRLDFIQEDIRRVPRKDFECVGDFQKIGRVD